jgi:ATP/maltotriose-dependent transcriptional regulator MalT
VLHANVRAAARGEGRVVVVDGPGGAGKSRILFDAAVTATALGIAVSVASADEQAPFVPFSPLVTALGTAFGPPPDGADDLRYWFFEQIRAEIESRAARSPVLIAIDDLHRAEGVTLQALQSLTAQLGSYPVLWVLAGRHADAGTPIDRTMRFLDRLDAVRIELRPLDDDAVAALVAHTVGGEPNDELLALARGAGGNPGLLTAIMEGLRDEGAVELFQGAARLVAAHVPRRLQADVAYRLGRLSADARRLLEVGAVLGGAFSPDDVAEVLGEPVGRLLPALADARQAEFVIATATSLTFRYDLVRWTVYELIPEPLRLALHRQIATMLLERGGSAEVAANHLVQSGAAGDLEALATLDHAAGDLLTSPTDAAADALHALDVTASTDGSHLARTIDAVDALLGAGRLRQADELAAAALTEAAAPSHSAALFDLARTMPQLMFGHGTTVVAGAERVLAAPGLTDDLYAEAGVARLLGLLTEGDLERAGALAETIIAGVERPRSQTELAAALTAWSFVAWSEGRVAEAVRLVRAAVSRSDRSPIGSYRLHPRLTLATLLSMVGEHTEAIDLVDRAAQGVEVLGEPEWAAIVPMTCARVHLAAGRIDAAESQAATGLELSEETGTRTVRPLGHWVLASAALLRGDVGRASEHTKACAAAVASLPDSPTSASYLLTEARLAEALHGAEAAIRVLAPLYTDLRANRRVLTLDPTTAACMARNAVAVGDEARAAAAAAEAAAWAADNPGLASPAAAAIHARGVVEGDATALEEAALRHRHPWARASALEDSGVALADVDPIAARERLERAHSGYRQMGAVRDADRVRRRLAALRAGRRRTPAPRPVEGWPSLTSTERRVSQLVAGGMTNSEAADAMSLSRFTVDFHLRQIFRKLRIRSRVDLTRRALEQDAS